jgi:hypothetical protein
MAVLTLHAHPAMAAAEDDAPDCLKAYEQAAHPYWLIVSDVLRFKTMFDNYDRLCTQHYPDDIAALQPAADTLRQQTNQDVQNAEAAIKSIFSNSLPGMVAPACADNKAARDKVQKNLLRAMKAQSKTVGARLEKSALTIRNPDTDLKLCRDLKPLSKKVFKALGPDLANPLFEMSVANSTFVARDSKARKQAFTIYRQTLDSLKSERAE